MAKLLQLTAILILAGTSTRLFAMEKIVESPQALFRKYMVFREHTETMGAPLDVKGLIWKTLLSLNKLEIEFPCPPLSKVDQGAAISLTVGRPKAYNNIHPPIKLMSIKVQNEVDEHNLPKTPHIFCFYEASGDCKNFKVQIHPRYSDGNVIDLATYDIKIVKNESAPADSLIDARKDYDFIAGYTKYKSEIATTDVKFVLTPK